MPVPEWADPRLSEDLASLRARGEGQGLEYMQAFPTQARELGKEIAAFATSNPGLILLGVADNGDLVGLEGMETAEGRDELQRRLEGICRGMVKPSITPGVAFAVEEERVILAVSIPRGNQPVYYCNSVPYVRHISESRPAEPHEVVELVEAARPLALSVAAIDEDLGARKRELATSVADAIHDVIILADQLEERSINPHMQELKSQFAYASEIARGIAATDEAQDAGVADALIAFADAAEAVSTYRMYLGSKSWGELTSLVQVAMDQARAVDNELVAKIDWPPEMVAWAQQRLRELAREVAQLSDRAERALGAGRLDELQQAVAQRGHELARLAYLTLRRADTEWLNRLRAVAKSLHLVETKRLQFDGGLSQQAVLGDIRAGAEALAQLAS